MPMYPAMTGEVWEEDTHWSGVLTALALARCGCEYLKCLPICGRSQRPELLSLAASI